MEMIRRLHIIESSTAISASTIRALVEQRVWQAGRAPCIIVDYLQLMHADKAADSASRRERVDGTISALKLLSRDYATPVIVISALSRAAYKAAPALDGFKETGGIEYTADVIYALTPAPERRAAGEDAMTAHLARDPRRVCLTCLKNRYGPAGTVIELSYHAACETFMPRRG